MKPNAFGRTKFACFAAYFTMSSIFSLPPLLFVMFHETYGISYTLLGTLVLINFCTQLAVDLVFTVFSKHFNVHKIVKVMPLITSAGLFIYASPNTLMRGLRSAQSFSPFPQDFPRCFSARSSRRSPRSIPKEI